MRTIISAAVRLAQSLDARTAAPAFLALSLKNMQMVLMCTRLAVGRHEIGECRPPVPNSGAQNFSNGSHQCRSLLSAERVAASGRMKSRGIQRLRGVDVSNSRDFPLVEKKSLQLLTATSRHFPESICVDPAVQGIQSDGTQLRYLVQARELVSDEQAESPVIPILQFR